MDANSPRRRAVAPILTAWFFLAASVICLVAGISIFTPASAIAGIWAIKPDAFDQLQALAPWSGLGFLVLSAVMASASYGAFARTRWAWALAVTIFAVNGLGDATQIAFGRWLEGTIGVFAAGLILYLLTRPRIKASFNR